MARNAKDGTHYTRQQTGHSLTLHLLLMCVAIGFVTVPYYSFSPNHYWHF